MGTCVIWIHAVLLVRLLCIPQMQGTSGEPLRSTGSGWHWIHFAVYLFFYLFYYYYSVKPAFVAQSDVRSWQARGW